MRRSFIVFAMVLASLTAAPAAHAGGWAVTSVVEMPEAFVPGEAHDVVFEIRQHGTRLVTDLSDVGVVLVRTDGPAEVRRFTASVEGTQWRATVVTPDTGSWTWRIEPGGFQAVQMGALEVVTPPPVESRLPSLRMWSGAFLVGAGAIILLARRRQQHPATA